MSDLERSASYWDHEHSAAEARSWTEHPIVREAINLRIGDGEPLWPLDWFSRWCGERTFQRALSLGSGGGALERDLVRRGLCKTVDALDASIASVATARRHAREENLTSIHYFVADFNRLSLPPERYDLVLFNQSLHHVDALERLLSTILGSLDPDGFLYLDEYVGPSRTWWTPRRFSAVRFVYDRLPEPLRNDRKLPLPVHAFDPSEAVRSGEILSRLSIGFETIETRPYGGNLLAPIFPSLAPDVPDGVISDLVTEEDAFLTEHSGAHYRIIVARPRRGLARRLSSLKYRVLAIHHSLGVARLAVTVRRFARRVFVAIDRRVRHKPIDHYQ